MSHDVTANDILARKPKKRVDWLQKRLREEQLSPGPRRDILYEVLTRKEGRSLVSDFTGVDATRVYTAVLSAMEHFTPRQQRVLKDAKYVLRQLHIQEEKAQSDRRKLLQQQRRQQQEQQQLQQQQPSPQQSPSSQKKHFRHDVRDSYETRPAAASVATDELDGSSASTPRGSQKSRSETDVGITHEGGPAEPQRNSSVLGVDSNETEGTAAADASGKGGGAAPAGRRKELRDAAQHGKQRRVDASPAVRSNSINEKTAGVASLPRAKASPTVKAKHLQATPGSPISPRSQPRSPWLSLPSPLSPLLDAEDCGGLLSQSLGSASPSSGRKSESAGLPRCDTKIDSPAPPHTPRAAKNLPDQAPPQVDAVAADASARRPGQSRALGPRNAITTSAPAGLRKRSRKVCSDSSAKDRSVPKSKRTKPVVASKAGEAQLQVLSERHAQAAPDLISASPRGMSALPASVVDIPALKSPFDEMPALDVELHNAMAPAAAMRRKCSAGARSADISSGMGQCDARSGRRAQLKRALAEKRRELEDLKTRCQDVSAAAAQPAPPLSVRGPPGSGGRDGALRRAAELHQSRLDAKRRRLEELIDKRRQAMRQGSGASGSAKVANDRQAPSMLVEVLESDEERL